MDSSTNGQVKVAHTNKSVNSRPIATRTMKTASPSQSPKTATDKPRPATAKTTGPPSKSASAKVTSGVKEATNGKNSVVRTATASPNKARTATLKDTASPVKPPGSQIIRQQTRDKGSPLLASKAEAGKKSVEGVQPGRPKAEGGNSTPTRQNGAAKKDVGKLTQHGIVPKDKTKCLQPEVSGSGPTKPLASSSSPAKPVKLPLTPKKPAKSIPAHDKPANTSPLASKAAKIKSSTSKLTNATSPTVKPVKTPSPLVKTPRLTSVPTKTLTPPTSAVKPTNATSSPAKLVKSPLVKPVNTTSTSNQVKQAKQTSVLTKPPSALNKPTNRSSVTAKPGTAAVKPTNEKRPVPKPVKTRESKQDMNPPKLECSENNVNVGEVVYAQVEQIDLCSPPVSESKVLENIESTEELLGNAQSTLESNTISNELSAEPSALDSEKKTGTLDQCLKSMKDLNNHIKKEEVHSIQNSDEDMLLIPEEQISSNLEENPTIVLPHEAVTQTLELKDEQVEPADLSEEGIQSSFSSLPEETLTPLQITNTCPLEEEVIPPVESLQDDLSLSSEMLMDQSKLLEEKEKTLDEQSPAITEEELEINAKPLEEIAVGKCLVDSDCDFHDKEPIPEELLEKEEPSSVKLTKPLNIEQMSSSETVPKEELLEPVELAYHSKEEVELLEKATYHVYEDTTLGEEPECQQKPLEEEIYSPVEHAEPSEEVQTSSLEQVTPLEEGVELSEDEIGFVDEPNTNVKVKGSTSPKHFEQFPSDFCKPLEIQVTSSMEEVTPSDEELEWSKAEDKALQERNISELLDGEDSKCFTDLDKEIEEAITSSEEVDEHLQEEIQTAELEQLIVTLPAECAKPLEDLLPSPAEPEDNVDKIPFSESNYSNTMCIEPVTYLEGLEASKDETQQLLSPGEDEDTELIKSFEEQEETLFKSSGANYPGDEFMPTIEQAGYGSKTASDFVDDSDEDSEQSSSTINQDLEQEEPLMKTLQDEAETNDNSADLEIFDEQGNIIDNVGKDPEGPLITQEKQLDSADTETDYMCSQINPEQPGLSSVLFPEEPLTSFKQSEITLLETASCLVEAPKTSLEPLKRADHAEDTMTSSICQLMGPPRDLDNSPFITACQVADITETQFTLYPENAETWPTTNTSPNNPGDVLLNSSGLINMIENTDKCFPPEEHLDISIPKPLDATTTETVEEEADPQIFEEENGPSNIIMLEVEQDETTFPADEEKEASDLINVQVEEDKDPFNFIPMSGEEEREPINFIPMSGEEEREPMNFVPTTEEEEPINFIIRSGEEEMEPIHLIPMSGEEEPINSITRYGEEEREPINFITRSGEEEREPINFIPMSGEEEREPINLIPMSGEEEPINFIPLSGEEERKPINFIPVSGDEQYEPNDFVTMPEENQENHPIDMTMPEGEEKEPIDMSMHEEEAFEPTELISEVDINTNSLIFVPVEEKPESINLITMPVEEENEPNEFIAVPEEEEPIYATMSMEGENEPANLISIPMEEEMKTNNLIIVPKEEEPMDLISRSVFEEEEPIVTAMSAPLVHSSDEQMTEMEPYGHTSYLEKSQLISLAETESHPPEEAWNLSTNNSELDISPSAVTNLSSKLFPFPADDHLEQQRIVTSDYDVDPAQSIGVTADSITFSDEGIKGNIQALSVENQCEVDKDDLQTCPSNTKDSWAPCEGSVKEQWVLVEKNELAGFREETEDKPQRPATLNQEDNQEEPKAEEETGERASVCSTLSDPQLAGKSSSETSTPEELRTYEDSSSGVESHSDDQATSPQTMLTPDPDLGIHMGQEEGSDTPAGTPASKTKGAPHPLQNASLEELSEGTSFSGVIKSSEDKEISHKMELTGFTCPGDSSVSREETAEERGPLRGNDD